MITSFFVVLVIRFKTQLVYRWCEWRIEVLKRQAKDSWDIADFYSDKCDEKSARRWIDKAFEAEAKREECVLLKEKYTKKGGE